MEIKKEWEQPNGKYKCPECNKEYTKMGIGNHIWRMHGDGKSFKPYLGKDGWSKGLTKETDPRLRKIGETYSKNYKSGKIKHPFKGKHLSEDMKAKISESMKKAHKEGRAWNIGQSRWNNEKSYPEQFFTKVIENEFNDKEYKTEYPIGIYSADFAWLHLKKVIEIDGQQHEKIEYKERDKRKDIYLKEQGWEVLRIKWTDMYKDTKEYIKIAKSFIDI